MFSKTERNYYKVKFQLLSEVHFVTRQFKNFLGRKFPMCTDNSYSSYFMKFLLGFFNPQRQIDGWSSLKPLNLIWFLQANDKPVLYQVWPVCCWALKGRWKHEDQYNGNCDCWFQYTDWQNGKATQKSAHVTRIDKNTLQQLFLHSVWEKRLRDQSRGSRKQDKLFKLETGCHKVQWLAKGPHIHGWRGKAWTNRGKHQTHLCDVVFSIEEAAINFMRLFSELKDRNRYILVIADSFSKCWKPILYPA